MSVEQLRLFPASKPLAERFGRDFFKRVPTAPGVYLMSGAPGTLLYIGKAKNLRQRLNSYKNAQPGRVSRKVLRLVCQVRSITWELCANPTTALLRENELLRLHKPKFNVLNTRPEHYLFWGLKMDTKEICLRLTKSDVPEKGERLYGAFKNLGRVRLTFRALLRLLWSAEHHPSSLYDLPSMMFKEKVSERFELRFQTLNADQLMPCLKAYLEGRSEDLCIWIQSQLTRKAVGALCLPKLFEQDLEIVREFFKYGPARNLNLRQNNELESELIGKGELDDLLVLESQRMSAPSAPVMQL